jgi:hypothetical protein
MLVPVGIAYAVASGLPGIYGLYATIVPLLAYALFGPSRILVLGPDSSLAALILAVVLPLSGGDPIRAVALAGIMAVVSGLVCILAGLLRLGFITELLSKPIRYGYMNGIALVVIVSQLPKLFGVSIDSVGPLRDLWQTGRSVLDGAANWTAFAIGAGHSRSGAQAPAAHPGPADRWGGDGRGLFDLGGERRPEGTRCASRRPSCIHAAVDPHGGSSRRGDRWFAVALAVRRYQRPVLYLRPGPEACRSNQRWSDRGDRPPDWRVSDQQQLIAHAVAGQPAPRRSSRAWSARWRSPCCSCWRRIYYATCPPVRWPAW